MVELMCKVEGNKMTLIDGRMRALAALSLSGEVQCSAVGFGLFNLVRNDDGSVDARFSDGALKRVGNLRFDQ